MQSFGGSGKFSTTAGCLQVSLLVVIRAKLNILWSFCDFKTSSIQPVKHSPFCIQQLQPWRRCPVCTQIRIRLRVHCFWSRWLRFNLGPYTWLFMEGQTLHVTRKHRARSENNRTIPILIAIAVFDRDMCENFRGRPQIIAVLWKRSRWLQKWSLYLVINRIAFKEEDVWSWPVTEVVSRVTGTCHPIPAIGAWDQWISPKRCCHLVNKNEVWMTELVKMWKSKSKLTPIWKYLMIWNYMTWYDNVNDITYMIYLYSYVKLISIISRDMISIIQNDGITKSKDVLCIVQWHYIVYTVHDIYDI